MKDTKAQAAKEVVPSKAPTAKAPPSAAQPNPTATPTGATSVTKQTAPPAAASVPLTAGPAGSAPPSLATNHPTSASGPAAPSPAGATAVAESRSSSSTGQASAPAAPPASASTAAASPSAAAQTVTATAPAAAPRPASEAAKESPKVIERPVVVDPPRVVPPTDILQQRAKSDVAPFRDERPSDAQRKSAPPQPPEEESFNDGVKMQPPYLFEVAWEVCWQLGGIYTVMRSKAACMLDDWGDRYFLIGPYNPATAAVEFEEQQPEGEIAEAIARLRQWSHVTAHFGRWLIPGRPRAILIEHRHRYYSLDHDKYLMWRDHGVSIAPDDGEVNDVVAFGFSVSEFFRHLTDVVKDRHILAHFHEWMAGVAIPRIAHTGLPVTTIFTTHATLLGRYLAGDNPYFYDHLPFFDGDKEAKKYMILSKHLIEKAAAHASTVFTTVSEVTGIEADKLLGRNPDVILPNGLNIHRFAALHEFQNMHLRYKERIHDFVMGHFFPSYTFDLDRTLYFFTAGRYEYKNKGFDMFIEALAHLNWRLKGMSDPPTIVAFMVTRAPSKNINVDVLRSQMQFDELRNTCADLKEHIGARLFKAVAQGRIPTEKDFLTEDAKAWLKRAIHAWRSHRQPPIVTHDLWEDGNDAILQHLRHRHLLNAADDPVKVIFHPEFVTATSPLIHLDYEQFVRGCHLGVFPSYYEPWGYTPLESIALGVPAIATDLSGFGAYVQHHIEKADEKGVVIIRRRDRSFDDSMHQLVNYLFQFVQTTRRQRIELRNRVEQTSEMFDWSKLIVHYREAHKLALSRKVVAKPAAV